MLSQGRFYVELDELRLFVCLRVFCALFARFFVCVVLTYTKLIAKSKTNS